MVMLLPSSREDSEDDSDHDQANLERSIDSLGPSVQRDQSGIVLDGSCPTSASYTDPPEIPSATNRSINSARRLPGIWARMWKVHGDQTRSRGGRQPVRQREASEYRVRFEHGMSTEPQTKAAERFPRLVMTRLTRPDQCVAALVSRRRRSALITKPQLTDVVYGQVRSSSAQDQQAVRFDQFIRWHGLENQGTPGDGDLDVSGGQADAIAQFFGHDEAARTVDGGSHEPRLPAPAGSAMSYGGTAFMNHAQSAEIQLPRRRSCS